MDITEDIQPLTTFRNNAAAFLQAIKKNHRPIVLTVNGKAAAVLQDAHEYQRMRDLAERADFHETIKQRKAEARQGQTMPAEEFFKTLDDKP